jgi:hypothetical protein
MTPAPKPTGSHGFPVWIRCAQCHTTRPPDRLTDGRCNDGWCERLKDPFAAPSQVAPR